MFIQDETVLIFKQKEKPLILLNEHVKGPNRCLLFTSNIHLFKDKSGSSG